jgi:hypothetical protein
MAPRWHLDLAQVFPGGELLPMLFCERPPINRDRTAARSAKVLVGGKGRDCSTGKSRGFKRLAPLCCLLHRPQRPCGSAYAGLRRQGHANRPPLFADAIRGMLIAALTSQSCSEPQLPQIQGRTDNGIASAFSPQHAMGVGPWSVRIGKGRRSHPVQIPRGKHRHTRGLHLGPKWRCSIRVIPRRRAAKDAQRMPNAPRSL